MRRSNRSRRRNTDLLARPPCTSRDHELGWAAHLIDPVAQLEELADLWRRGVLTAQELEQHKAKVLGR